jgi:hypothetical protein
MEEIIMRKIIKTDGDFDFIIALQDRIEELKQQIKEDDETICALCKIINPQHKDCNSCSERDERKLVLGE